MRKYSVGFIKIFTVFLVLLSLTSCGAVSDVIHIVQDYKTKRAIGEPNLSIISHSKDEYVYQTLNDEEKLVYDQMYECMDELNEKTPLSTKNEDVIKKCFDCIMADHGEHFYWIDSYSYQVYRSNKDNYISGISFAPSYNMTLEEKEKTDKAIESVYNEWIADLPEDATDYQKSKYVYDKLINEVDYVADSPDNQNIKSVFLNKATVCKGYANSVSYFFDKLGIPCTVITGEANGGHHAWNLVNLDGEYYYYDVTWGNSSYRNMELSEKRINYSYLNVTADEIERTHEAKDIFPLPECNSTEDNYFVKEGFFLDENNFNEYGDKIYQMFSQNFPSVSLRFSDEELYNKAFNHLITEKRFSDYCPGINSISYLEDKEVYTLTIIF